MADPLAPPATPAPIIPAAWKRGRRASPPSSNIVALIRSRAGSAPGGADALVASSGARLSFGQLDQLSLGVARLLRLRTAGRRQSSGPASPTVFRDGATKGESQSQDREGRSGIALVCCDHETWTPLSVLGCLYAGLVYTPVSPLEPRRRLDEIIRVLEPEVVIVETEGRAKEVSEGFAVPCVSIADLSREAPAVKRRSGESAAPPGAHRDLKHPCWIHMTSGSTGTPKGVVVDHNAVVQRCLHKAEALGYGPNSVVLLATPFTFDPYATDLLSALSAGASVASFQSADILSNLPTVIDRAKVTHLCTTPSLWSTVRPCSPHSRPLRSLKVLTLIGERMPSSMLREWSAKNINARLFNMYGVTEATDTQFTCEVSSQEKEQKSSGCVGHPDPAVQVELISLPKSGVANTGRANTTEIKSSAHLTLVNRVGTVGEIAIGGPKLAMGYFRDSVKTSKQFVTLETVSEGPKRFYRTGDLGFWRQDGNMELLGRMDNQVKILGKRVELEEVSACAVKHPCVQKAAAVLIEKENQNDSADDSRDSKSVQRKQLVLCVHLCLPSKVENGERNPKDEKESFRSVKLEGRDLQDTLDGLEVVLRAWCESRLSRHLVPSRIEFMTQTSIPLTHTGKVDRKKLLEIVAIRSSGQGPHGDVEAPRDAIEALVAQAWAAELLPSDERTVISDKTCQDQNSTSSQPSRPRIDRTANFFELGGDSLSALRVCKAVAVSLGPSVKVDHKYGIISGPFNVRELLKRPRLDQYSQYLKESGLLEKHYDVPETQEIRNSIIRMKKLSSLQKRKSGSTVITKRDARLNKGLCGTIKLGWTAGVRALLDAEADINGHVSRNNPGLSPLHFAARKGYVDIAEVLVEAKAYVNSVTSNRESPLHSAAGGGTTASSMLRYLLSVKANSLARDSNSQTFIHTAARTGNHKGLRTLTQINGALSDFRKSLSVFDRWGRTPLHWAVLNSHFETVQLLLDSGANPNHKLKSSVQRSRTRLPAESAVELAIRVHGESSNFTNTLRSAISATTENSGLANSSDAAQAPVESPPVKLDDPNEATELCAASFKLHS